MTGNLTEGKVAHLISFDKLNVENHMILTCLFGEPSIAKG